MKLETVPYFVVKSYSFHFFFMFINLGYSIETSQSLMSVVSVLTKPLENVS